MPASKKLIEGCRGIAVIDFKMLMVQVMEMVSGNDIRRFREDQPDEARMRNCRTQSIKKTSQDDYGRMHRDHPPQQEQGEIDHVLQRMHGDARPGPCVDITVMHFMVGLV